MQVVTTKAELQQFLKIEKKQQKTIGFVPTMGFLHEGHLTLVKHACQENDIVVMSIFVNPLQFGPEEDFDAYPRNQERDEQLADEAGVDYLFVPSVEEIYPHPLSIKLSVEKRVNVLCGNKRPGHFDGVATVLTKLFHIIMPDRAYFGRKDAQQLAVVDGLVQDLDIPIKLVGVETVREADGLAKSSRNVYLTDAERKEAAVLYKSLKRAEKAILEGERQPEQIIQLVRNCLHKHTNAQVEYVEIYQYPTLEEAASIYRTILIAIAVRFKKARLIDNLILDIPLAD